MTINHQKPPRTIGIALAIIIGALLYTLTPTAIVAFTWTLQRRMADSGVTVGIDPARAMGGSSGFLSVSSTELALWLIGAVIFLIVAVLTWRGRPSSMRFIYVVAVIIMPVYYLSLWFYRTSKDQQLLQEAGALTPQTTFTGLCSTAAIFPALATLYIIWYMNRGPARAFFRGYYLTENPQE
jgi:hypothetical protein